jgi:mono/diheme cytochrome c family protein
MAVRGLTLVGFAVIASLAALGCGGEPKPRPPEEDRYPVRSDWLVKDVPSTAQPTRYFEPGYPPLAQLNRPFDTLTGEDAILVPLAKNRTILNTSSRAVLNSDGSKAAGSRVEEDVREEFGKVLTELYGTPVEPRVPSGEELIGPAKLSDKLAEARQGAEEKRDEADKAKAAARTPAEREAADALAKQATALETDARALETKLDDLRTYDAALRLDPETLKRGGILYRNYCQQCHGLTGDGNGPAGKSLVPMPRDYREGLFKFITTDPSVGAKRKPRRDDLRRTIANGLDGSPMPQFGALRPDEIEALVSYVIHLSMRGEAEYQVMKKAADASGGEDFEREDVRKQLFAQAAEIAPLWAASARTPIIPDPDPYTTDDQRDDAAANGYKLFVSKDVGCAQCHTGFGRSSPYQFDSWGTIVRPRNLTVASLRGGRSPEAIYDRILGGIPGSNMPAHPHLRPNDAEKEKGQHKIWDLVYFVRYLGESEKRRLLKDKYEIEID